MLKIYPEILDAERLSIFRELGVLDKDAYLIGGTAIALQIKHRKSIDFDLAFKDPIDSTLLSKARSIFKNYKLSVLVDSPNELTILLDSVKVTFLHYPFTNLHPVVKTEYLKLASFEDLASTKIQTIGRRGEWKDYVDIYFLITKEGINIDKAIEEAKARFKEEFSEKLFWGQLVYWEDLHDFEIEYIEKPIPKEKIQTYFKELASKKFA